MIKCFVLGNLTRDAEMKATRSGKPMCTFTLASERKRKNAEGRRETEFFQVTCFGKIAEAMAQYLGKGRRVIAIGEVSASAYMGNDNKPKCGMSILADEVYFVGGKSDVEADNKPGAGSSPDNYQKQAQDIPAGFAEVDIEELPF